MHGGGYYADNEIVRTVGSIVVNGSAHGNMPIWFLFSYFFVRIGFAFQQTYLRQVSLIWFALFCLIIPFVLHFCTFRYPYYFANVALGLFGYYAGYVYNLNADKGENLIAVISALLYVDIFVFCESLVDIRTNTLYEGFYLLWALWSISGCIFFYFLFKKVKFLREIFCRLGIASIGQMSMSILILPWPLLIIADFIRYYCLDIPKNYYLIYYLLVIVIFTVPLHFYLKKSKLKFLIGL